MWRCGKTRQHLLREMWSRTEKELNTKLGQKRPQQCGLFCCNLGLIRYADIVIITGNLCNGKILNAYNGAEDFSFSEALHCYFNVSSLENITIKGLRGHQYKSSLDGKVYELADDLQIGGEFDAAFLNHSGNIEIVDKGYKRKICIEKSGSKSTVVWNPAKDLAEMSAGQYKQFVCVEPANQGDYFVRLKPHETHSISMVIQVEKL